MSERPSWPRFVRLLESIGSPRCGKIRFEDEYGPIEISEFVPFDLLPDVFIYIDRDGKFRAYKRDPEQTRKGLDDLFGMPKWMRSRGPRRSGADHVRELRAAAKAHPEKAFRRTAPDYYKLCEATKLFPGADGVRSYRFDQLNWFAYRPGKLIASANFCLRPFGLEILSTRLRRPGVGQAPRREWARALWRRLTAKTRAMLGFRPPTTENPQAARTSATQTVPVPPAEGYREGGASAPDRPSSSPSQKIKRD